MKRTHIGVFLSSKSSLPEAYTQATRQVGQWIGSTGRTLVYGGARKGLMEELAQSVKQSGGRVYGMVPQIIEERHLVSEHIDVNFRCVNLSDRKELLLRESQLLVALPGGIGTLDEVFSVLANATIGIERKPVVFYNVDDCWTPLLDALDRLFAAGLIDGRPSDFYTVVTTIDELERAAEQ